MIRTRPSAMPRAFGCPSSLVETANPVNTSSDESDLGDAVHVALRLHVSQLEVDLGAIASEHSVDVNDLEPLFSYGTKAWRELSPHFPSPRTECALDPTDITTGGTADVLHASAETAVVNDWKSGRVRRNAREQLASYAYALRQQYGMPASGVIKGVATWLRFGEIEVYDFDSAALDAFAQSYALDVVDQIGKRYAPGEHCTFCPRVNECEARTAFLRGAAMVVAEGPGPLAPADLAALYPRAQMLEKALEAYRKALRLAVQEHGPLPIGDGRVVSLAEQSRDVIDARTAWPILQELGLTDDELAAATSIAKGAIEDAIKDKAPRGMKQKRLMQALERLRQSGALIRTTHQRLEVAAEGSK